MLTIGDHFPEFKLKAVISNDVTNAFTELTEKSYPDKWRVYFFWPKDFTFVCPTEIAEFDNLNDEFKKRNAVVVGGSTDNEFVHLAWRKNNPQLHNLSIPLLSDIKRELCCTLGILHKKEGVALRATFIVDPANIIRHVSVYDLSVGRNSQEVLRTLDALQTEQLTPCNWEPGKSTINPAAA